MARLPVLIMVALVVAMPRPSAACRRAGTQLECDVAGRRVVVGRQVAEQTPQRFPTLSFHGGNGAFPDDDAPAGRRSGIELQNVGVDPTLCRKIGNETYCY